MSPTKAGRCERSPIFVANGPTVTLLAFSSGKRFGGSINISAGSAEMLSR